MNTPLGTNKPQVFLEVLEERIAPAAVVLSQGGNLLSTGDEGQLSLGDQSAVLVKVLGGKALVFWDAQDKAIKGISVTTNANLEIHGNVAGDIVTNLLSSGSLTDSDNNPANGLDGGKLLDSTIKGITVTSFINQAGNIESGNVGRIVAGGAVSNIHVSGDLGGVFSGDGIFNAVATANSPTLAKSTPATTYSYAIGFDFDSSGPLNATSMFLTKADATSATNPAISHVSFTTGRNVQIFSGDGADGVAGARAAGAPISDVHFVATTIDSSVAANYFKGKSMTISAGDGGSGSATGGIGGAISDIVEAGSLGDVVIHSGNGGNGSTTGGAGGKITQLDLHGTPHNYLVQAGAGGTGGTTGGAGGVIINNNIASISSSQFITLAGNFHSDFTTAPATDAERGFFVINRSSGEMTLISGDTLHTIPPVILPKAANPVDGIIADINRDGFLDVVVAYGDGHFGVLINNQADGFRYSVGSLDGLIPSKVIAGDFLGTGGPSELTFVANTGSATTLQMYEVTTPSALAGPDPASAFSSDPSLIKPFTYNKSGLADALGGSFPLSTLGALRLNADQQDDMFLAFGDGRIQGVYATGSATAGDPFTFGLGTGALAAPTAKLASGIRDLDFNFAKDPGQRSLAIVNSGGTDAYIANIGAATLIAPATINISKTPLPDAGPAGTITQAHWTDSILDANDTKSTSLTLLASVGTGSSILSYNTSFGLKAVYQQDFQINGLADNFLMASKSASGEADSFIFSTPSAVLALAYQHTLPATPPLVLSDIALPFAAKTATILAGDGGGAGKGTGGAGGDIISLNLDSGSSDIFAGDGGTSTSGAGGVGGSINNAKSYLTVGKLLVVPSLSSSSDLNIAAGEGAAVTGTASAARGGKGGNVQSLVVLNSAALNLSAGDGGGSKGGAAGNGGLIDSIAVYNAGDMNIIAGDGGYGSASALAPGGNGGSISKLTLGSASATDGRAVSGYVDIRAGSGGLSDLAKGGSGGAVSTITAGNATDALGSFVIASGNGASTFGTAPAASGGTGGSISGVNLNKIAGGILLSAKSGGNAVAGTPGNGGSIAKILSTKSGILSAIGGDGGSATGPGSKGVGGSGGTVNGLTSEMVGSGYSNIFTGSGGSSVGGAGGSGGAVSNLTLWLNPGSNGALDETLGLKIQTGKGGNGASGGAGGLISLLQLNGIYDESAGVQTAINSIALLMVAGDGGNATAAAGGNGGSIKLTKTLQGISHIDQQAATPGFLPTDEGLRAFAGNGGNGITRGGEGGVVTGLKVVNPLSASGKVIPTNLLGGAYVRGGDGGNAGNGTAGAGGAVSGLSLGVEGPAGVLTGNLRVQAGDGGTATLGTGGAGGSVSGSNLVVIKGNDAAGYATLVTAGNGGSGSLRGGNGGNLSSLTNTLPQVGVANTAPNIYSGVFFAGTGGSGSGALKSTGGMGGSISGISQTQNVYSVINLLQAGGGGNSSSDVFGGKGGSVSSVKTVGSIGAQVARTTVGGPQIWQGIYNTVATSTLIDSLVTTPDLQQGVFAGLGGSGSKSGVNGNVSGIQAQTIAAIAAANRSGTFEKAASVSTIITLLLGYDINGSGTYQAGDGFVMAANNKIASLTSLNTQLISTAALQSNTAPFIIP